MDRSSERNNVTRRIAYIIANLHYGGTERHLIEVLTHLDRTRYEPSVFCRGDGGPLVETIREMGVPVYVCGIGRWYTPEGLWREKRLSDELREFKPEVVSIYMDNFFLPEVLACVGAGADRIILNHRVAFLELSWRIRLAMAQAARLARRQVACSHAVAESLLELGVARPEKVTVYYNGVDPAPFQKPLDTAALRDSLGVGPQEYVIGVVSRMIPRKRHVDLVEALALLRDEGRKFRCVMVGDGESRPAIEAKLAELNLGERVLLTGARSDGRDIVRIFDVSVLPTLVEGSPNAVIESMLAGVPVISTDAPGVREIMNHGVTSLMVPTRDPAALARAIRQLMENPDYGTRLARAGKAYAEETFALKKMMDGFMAIYDEVARGH